jgi:hypothetical protein
MKVKIPTLSHRTREGWGTRFIESLGAGFAADQGGIE